MGEHFDESKEARTTSGPALAHSATSRWLWMIALLIICASVTVSVFRPWPLSPPGRAEASPPTTDAGEAAAFGPTIVNTTLEPTPSPPGMVWI